MLPENIVMVGAIESLLHRIGSYIEIIQYSNTSKMPGEGVGISEFWSSQIFSLEKIIRDLGQR